MTNNGVNVYEREKLYEEVWNLPVIKVAESYGVSNVAIKKICKSMNIPTPPNGYWAKLKYGKEVEKAPLPPLENGVSIKYGTKPLNPNEKSNDDNHNPLPFLSLEEYEKLRDISSSLKIDHNKEFCNEIMNYQKIVSEWNRTHYSIEGWHYSHSEYIYRNSYAIMNQPLVPVLAGVLSKVSLMRVYKILDCIIEGLKRLGYQPNDDMSFNIRGEKVEFVIREKQEYFDHIITEKEIKAMQKYEYDIKHNRLALKPEFLSKEYRFNGQLIFTTKKNKYIRDTDKYSIEDRLPDMLIQLVEQSEVVRQERLIKEEEQRKKDEERRNYEVRLDKYNNEIDKLTLLLQEVNDFAFATKIRDYIWYVQQKDVRHQKSDWISWAKEKADWYDPSVDKIDSILGKREQDAKLIPDKMKNKHWW